ncbi:MAG: DNA internalization-related competence protein ComEC/Rec2 [Candidatus Rokubacteria bacterium]|nr:DNA internalization-related competence protein ComEC/Rec2 [Candidatus Rokubacteria bacterium]
MSAPLLPLALAFALGAGIGLGVEAPLWLGPAGLAGAALLLMAGRGRSLAGASIGVVVLCVLAGWARVALPDPFPPVRGIVSGPTVLEGLVGGALEIEGPRTRFPLVLRGTGTEPVRPAAGVVPLSLYGPAPPLTPGDHVRVAGEVRALEPFRNPGAEPRGGRPRTPRHFATARATGVERLPPAPVPWWLRTRLWIHTVIEGHLPPVSGALLEGLLIGERRQLPPTLLGDFRRAGVYHVLAISGFNVALVAGSAFLLFRLVRVPAPLAAVLALATLLAFAAVVGGQPSVLRATVMGGLFLAAGLLGRESRVWNSLAAALVVLLVLDPGSLAEPGLQLSFAATAGLLHLGPWTRARLAPWCPGPIASALAVSVGAQLGVTPVMLLHFGQLSPLGVVANLLVVPLAGLLTTGGVLTLAVATVSEPVARPLFQSLWLLLVLLRVIVRAFAALPGAIVYVSPPPALAVAAAGLALLFLPWARGRAAALGVAALAIGAGLATIVAALPDGLARVVVLDVGQGEAILIRAPNGQALLVDTGGGGPGRGDRGERVVVPVLRRLGLRRLTALALTEGAADHAGGLAGLLEGMPIDEVWIPAGSEGAAWLGPVAARGIPRRVLARGDRRWIGPLLVTVLHPGRTTTPGEPESGERAREEPLLLRVEWGLFAAVLATGTGTAEATTLGAGQPLEATMLKVSGNGSRRGSPPEFLAAVGPRLAAIPVGARNPFGHPAADVLARLGAVGAMVYRTDQDGAIDVRSDGIRVWARAWGRPGPPVMLLLRDGL